MYCFLSQFFQITFTREWVTGKRSISPKVKVVMHEEDQTFCRSLIPAIDFLLEVKMINNFNFRKLNNLIGSKNIYLNLEIHRRKRLEKKSAALNLKPFLRPSFGTDLCNRTKSQTPSTLAHQWNLQILLKEMWQVEFENLLNLIHIHEKCCKKINTSGNKYALRRRF